MPPLTISVVIPTYCRERVLIETVQYLLDLAEKTKGFIELIIVDQTPQHEPETERQLSVWKDLRAIKWLRQDEPHITRSMNLGLLVARGDIVLFTDDDIIPGKDLLENHLMAYQNNINISAVVGQVIQPGEEPEDIHYQPSGSHLTRFMDFPFRRTEGMMVENAMAGNFSMIREYAIYLGGFDENFTPPVASRFESEFAKRLIENGGKIWFEPVASIRHLQVAEGGTRSKGSHLNSISPRYGVGDYYFALRRGKGWECFRYMFKKPFREIRTKYHLKHPWWIPIKFIGEMRAIVQAFHLYRKAPDLIHPNNDFEAPEV